MKLQTKVTSVLAALGLSSGALILLLSRQAVNRILITGLAERGILESAEIVSKINAGVQTKDENDILPHLLAGMAATHASYVVALDPGGAVLAHTNVVEKGKVYGDPITRAALGRDKPGFQPVDMQGRKTLDVAIPIWAKDEDFLFSRGKRGRTRIGTLRMGLPLEGALATQARILGRISLILLLTGGVMVAVISLFLRKTLSPVRLLAEAAGKIGQGQYGIAIPVSSKDELGDLTRSFNRMSADLAASVSYLDGVIRSIADILIVTNREGNIQTINRTALEISGYAEEELLGGPIRLLLDPSQEEGGAGLFQELSSESSGRKGSVKDRELVLLTKTGQRVPVLLSGAVLKSKDGGSDGVVIVAKDLRERKSMESRMAQSEKLSAVGQLAAGVAHEINNPLCVILGFAQGMSRQLKDGDALDLPVKSIEREALRCRNLVQSLLTFARTSHSDRAALDINAPIEQALALVQTQVKMVKVRLEASLAGGLPLILGNKTQIEQVVLNLAKNALDAMPDGGTLSISTRLLKDAPHSWVCLEVSDTGTGIPSALVQKIFEPFFTTKAVGQGTGLGLSLVSEIVKKHSGTVEVESRPGMTVFTVKLPARTGSEMEERQRAVEQERLAESFAAPGWKP